MFRFTRPMLALVCATALSTVALAACSGSQQSATPIVRAATSAPAPVASTPGSTSASTATGSVTLSVTIPRKTVAAAKHRRPNYISANVEEIDLSMIAPNANGVTGATQSGIVNGTNCPSLQAKGATSIVCTFTFIEPLGTATFLIVANDNTALDPVIVAQQEFTQTLYAKPVSLSITLDAVIGSADVPGIAVTTSAACVPGEKCGIERAAPGRTVSGRRRDKSAPSSTIALTGAGCADQADFDGPADLSTTCGATLDATGTAAFGLTLADADGDVIAPGVPGYPTVSLTSSNPTTFSPSLSADGTAIDVAASGTGQAVITATFAGASPGDGIATRTLKFAVGYGAIYVADGGSVIGTAARSRARVLTADAATTSGGIVVLGFPLATVARATLGAGDAYDNIAFDSSGNLYGTDTSAPQLSIFDYNGVGSPFDATPDAMNPNVVVPNGLAFFPASDHELFVGDDSTGILGIGGPAYTGTPGSEDKTYTGGTYTNPTQLAFDASANAYLPDSATDTIDYVAYGGTPPSAIGYALPAGASPQAVVFDSVGAMYVPEAGLTQVAIYMSGGAFVASPLAPTATITTTAAPYGVGFDSGGTMYVSEANGTIETFAPPYTNGAIANATIGGSPLGSPDGILIYGGPPTAPPQAQ